ncbi:MAG: glycosyltransferase family 2 protein [Deltaproteobacteria bacterium]|nr:glycosyltransferase family 2 protein [Deltaproteobacteria bacterium]
MSLSPLETALLVTYFGVLLVLSMYGTHRYYMAYLYYRYRHNRRDRMRPPAFEDAWPRVTVQLPVFNERYVVERLIDAVCQFDYPRDRLSVQVLDDSTDDTVEISRARVEHWRAHGVDVELIHRQDRSGYKAGALENGLHRTQGDLIAVFDADFVPEPDFLKQTVPHFVDPGIGMVQVRWGHINRDFSPLTQAQAILLDGHFVIEHSARNRSGRFFNFNGTAGIWRRSTIVDAGGWQHDTLTEDLDLSYRAQLKGWRFVFLQDVVSPGEVPVDINAFKSQQHRWAKGSVQTALKLLPQLLRSNQPLPIKTEAFFHLTANFAYPLLVLLSLLMPLSILVRSHHSLAEVLLLDIPCFMAATMSVCSFYAMSQREIGEAKWQRIKYIPFVMSMGIGLSLSNSKAVIEALLGHESPFLRTPKHGVLKTGEAWKNKLYRGTKSLLPYLEVALGLYYSITLYLAVRAEHWGALPFLVLFQFGFLYVGVMSLLQTYGARPALSEPSDSTKSIAERRAA